MIRFLTTLAIAGALTALSGCARTEPLFCGDSDDPPCPIGMVCELNRCVFKSAAECPDGQTLCGNTCVTLRTDPENCGVCGRGCANNEVCANGICTSSCPAGTTECGRACVNTDADEQHCGACDVACAR